MKGSAESLILAFFLFLVSYCLGAIVRRDRTFSAFHQRLLSDDHLYLSIPTNPPVQRHHMSVDKGKGDAYHDYHGYGFDYGSRSKGYSRGYYRKHGKGSKGMGVMGYSKLAKRGKGRSKWLGDYYYGGKGGEPYYGWDKGGALLGNGKRDDYGKGNVDTYYGKGMGGYFGGYYYSSSKKSTKGSKRGSKKGGNYHNDYYYDYYYNDGYYYGKSSRDEYGKGKGGEAYSGEGKGEEYGKGKGEVGDCSRRRKGGHYYRNDQGKGCELPTRVPTPPREPTTVAPTPKPTTSPVEPTPTAPTSPVAPPTAAPESPTQPVTSSPTKPTGPTPTHPPTGDPVPVEVSPYNNLYTIDQFRIPVDAEYVAVASLTQAYLDEFFRVNFASSSLTRFVEALTVMTDNEFIFGKPLRIDFNTTVLFSERSEFVPPQAQVNGLLQSAFRGENNAVYVSILQDELPVSNIFSTTTAVEFSFSAVTVPNNVGSGITLDDNEPISPKASNPTRHTASAKRSIVSALSATAGIVFLAGMVVFCRRRQEQAEDSKYRANANTGGHITVAGDTYEGNDSTVTGDWQSTLPASCSTRVQDCDSSSISPSEWGDFPGERDRTGRPILDQTPTTDTETPSSSRQEECQKGGGESPIVSQQPES